MTPGSVKEVYLGERTTTPNTGSVTYANVRSLLGRKDDNSQQPTGALWWCMKSTWEKGRQLPTRLARYVKICEVYLGERTTTPNQLPCLRCGSRSLLGRKDDNSQLSTQWAGVVGKSTWEKGRQLPTPNGSFNVEYEVYLGERTTTPNVASVMFRSVGSLLGRKDDNSQRRLLDRSRRQKSTWEKGRQLPTRVRSPHRRHEVYLGERTTTPNQVTTVNEQLRSLLGRKDDNSQQQSGEEHGV